MWHHQVRAEELCLVLTWLPELQQDAVRCGSWELGVGLKVGREAQALPLSLSGPGWSGRGLQVGWECRGAEEDSRAFSPGAAPGVGR